MDKQNIPTETQETITVTPGLYAFGLPMWPNVRLINQKDNSGQLVVVEQEIAVNPGVVRYSQFLDPTAADNQVIIQNGKVVQYPSFTQLQPVALRISGLRATKDSTSFTRAEVVKFTVYGERKSDK